MFSTCIKFFNLIFQSISPRPTSIEDMHYKHLFQNSSGISTPKLVQVNSPRKILLKMYQNLIENTCLEIEKLSSVLFCLTARHWSGRCSTAVEGKLDEKNSFSRIRPLMKWASKMKKTEFFIEILRSFEDPKQKAINKQPRIFSGTRRRPSCKSYFLFITFFSRVSQSPILLFFSPKNPFFSSRVENSLSQKAAKKSSEKKTRRTRWRRKSWKNKSTFNSRIRIGEGIHRSSIRSWGDEKPVFISQVFFPSSSLFSSSLRFFAEAADALGPSRPLYSPLSVSPLRLWRCETKGKQELSGSSFWVAGMEIVSRCVCALVNCTWNGISVEAHIGFFLRFFLEPKNPITEDAKRCTFLRCFTYLKHVRKGQAGIARRAASFNVLWASKRAFQSSKWNE